MESQTDPGGDVGENFEINEDMGDDYDSDSEFLKSFGQT